MTRLDDLPPDAEAPPEPEPRATGAAWLLLGLLFLAYLLSLVDRVLLALLVQPIKADLGLTDTQLGVLQGLAFVLLYCTLALPLGLLVDRRRRVPIVAGGIALWSIMTALCGVAAYYWVLFAGRVGVGVGEATLGPATPSLIADGFPRARLGIATSIFALGASMGAGLSLLVGGVVVQAIEAGGPRTIPLLGTIRPWQQTFLLVGLPGLLLAGVIALVPEPARRDAHRTAPPLAEVRRFLWRSRAWLVPHVVAVGLAGMVLFGTTSWIIAFFARAHHWGVRQAGIAAGLATIGGALVGLLGGGTISDRAHRAGAHGRLLVCAAAMAIGTFAAAIYPLVASPVAAAIVWGIVMMNAAIPIGVGSANLQEMTPGRMRGVVSALYGFVASLIGIGGGPALIAIVADRLFPQADGLRYALAWVGGTAAALSALGLLAAALVQRRATATEARR